MLMTNPANDLALARGAVGGDLGCEVCACELDKRQRGGLNHQKMQNNNLSGKGLEIIKPEFANCGALFLYNWLVLTVRALLPPRTVACIEEERFVMKFCAFVFRRFSAIPNNS